MYDTNVYRHKHINQYTTGNYDNRQAKKYTVTKPSSDDMKIPTQKILLNIDYDLPLTELQYTKTRKYKQNLNPIFQLLSTNNHRYTHYQHQIPQKPDQPTHSRPKLYKKKGQKQQITQPQINDKLPYEKNKKVFSYVSDISSLQKQKLNKISEIQKTKKFIDQNVRKHQSLTKQQKLNQFKQYQNQKILSSQIASQFLKQTQNNKNKILLQIQESNQRLSVLKQKVSMLKEKNILKERQIYFNNEQKIRQQKKLKALEKSFKNCTQLNKDYETHHHEIFKALKEKKKQLKKQQKWLKEQNEGIQKIKKQIQLLLVDMRNLQREKEERQTLMRQIKQEQELNKELQSELQDGNSQLTGLKQQIQILEEQTKTLQLHQNQLNNLELKFKAQTQKVKEHFYQVNSQYQQKNDLISQQKQIDGIIKELELQIGQMNQQKIILQQHIQQIHLKISIKNNNIKHIKNLQSQKYYYQPQRKSVQVSPSVFSKNIKAENQNFTKNYNLHPKNEALPTIRQQSKNTSLYQTPRNQQVFITEENQQSHHPFSSNSLQIDSHSPARTQILKPHQEKNQKQLKKYFVIESEEDGNSNNKSLLGLRKTEDFFINKEKNSSNQQRIQDRNHQHMKTQNQEIQPSDRSKEFNMKFINQSTSLERQNKAKRQEKSRQKKSIQKLEQSVDNESQEAFQTLIQRFEQIKSNSYFDESWRQKF